MEISNDGKAKCPKCDEVKVFICHDEHSLKTPKRTEYLVIRCGNHECGAFLGILPMQKEYVKSYKDVIHK